MDAMTNKSCEDAEDPVKKKRSPDSGIWHSSQNDRQWKWIKPNIDYSL